jgi:hypothetical protein
LFFFMMSALAQFLEFRRLDPTKALAAYESTVVAAPHEPQVLCALAVFKGTHTRSCWSFMLAKNTALTPSPAPHLPHPTQPTPPPMPRTAPTTPTVRKRCTEVRWIRTHCTLKRCWVWRNCCGTKEEKKTRQKVRGSVMPVGDACW